MRASWAVIAVMLMAAPARAEENPAAREVMSHMARGARSARVGDWVTYRFDGGAGGMRIYYWRMAVVGEEKDKEGRDAVWVEMEAGMHPSMKSPLMQMRMLVAREGEQIRYDAISRLFVGGPTDRPQEYSQEALDHVLKTMDQEEKDNKVPDPEDAKVVLPAGVKPVLRTGKETRVMTLAGTVTVVPVELVMKKTVVKRMWISREIPLMQLAKMEIPGIAHSMEVAEYGIDAKPRMVLPPPSAPKVRLEYADRIFPDLPGMDAPKEPADSENAP
ncbi:hypothetical protein HUA74_20470 [Myxococcus sp. CA051A]|uniref:hypothetical protein n=1 Tax=unclassified Myxococcus TaxID=2648731 RepID=UPI00157AFB6F|nr:MULTISPECIES: hypothetical protein [unclassified Myxococcus]NTX01582.1 hypothetical protein [Myxococcus sp. CA040A]NTX16222.1 hypothetical protein [Myxococcus sp. CA056]NTX40137.1 hypothetical protein [Myxococcus sp. CA033]NTX56120.1 hypothetical protein [Myxococcus sp. CA039A]NTX63027.1 hypothetical protein [Myxococcus sp. CA051A]